MWWSWLLTAVGVFGLYMAGRKVWWAWLIGLGAQVLWLAYAVSTRQYGFIVSAVAYGWVYGKNALAWRRAAIHDGEATPQPEPTQMGLRKRDEIEDRLSSIRSLMLTRPPRTTADALRALADDIQGTAIDGEA